MSSREGVHERLHAAAFCQLDEEAAHLAATIQQKPATKAAGSAMSVRRPAVGQACAVTPLAWLACKSKTEERDSWQHVKSYLSSQGPSSTKHAAQYQDLMSGEHGAVENGATSMHKNSLPHLASSIPHIRSHGDCSLCRHHAGTRQCKPYMGLAAPGPRSGAAHSAGVQVGGRKLHGLALRLPRRRERVPASPMPCLG